jgi:CheY-like chemotaxis protein
VLIDPLRIHQVLDNLIGNAIKFTEQGRVTITARNLDSNFVSVDVIDTGIGIAEHDIPLVFDAFQQISNINNRAFEGTGLGVPISNELILLHGGILTIKSSVGRGTVLTFTLPRAEPNAVPLKPDFDTDEVTQMHSTSSSSHSLKGSKDSPFARSVELRRKKQQCHEIMNQKSNVFSPDEAQLKNIGPDPSVSHAVETEITTTKKIIPLLAMPTQKITIDAPFNIVPSSRRREIIYPITKTTTKTRVTSTTSAHCLSTTPTRQLQREDIAVSITKAVDKSENKKLPLRKEEDHMLMDVSLLVKNETNKVFESPTPPFRSNAKSKLARFSGAVILTVDDSPINLQIITRFLKETPLCLVTANGGLEAIEAVKKQQISLILMDVMMPDLDGYETTRRIRQLHPKELLPIFFVTAKAEEPEGKQAGGNGYIPKPVKRVTLLKEITRALTQCQKNKKKGGGKDRVG